jgi:putative drug exporter of the RND superfamily
MATYLFRLGRTAFRHRWEVLIAWGIVLVLAVSAAATLGGTPRDEFSIPGTQAQRGLDLLAERFPEASGAGGRIVFAAPDGARLSDPPVAAAVAEVVARAGQAPQVLAVVDPFASRAVAPDLRTAYATVQYAVPFEDLDPASVDALEEQLQPARDAGLQVELGGEAFHEVPEGSHLSEVLGLGAAVVVLLVTFGSVLAAGLPLLLAFTGVGIGMALLTAASGLFALSSTAPVLALMIGLAVGIDYTLFIVSRHRQQLADGMAPEESAARAIATAGGAVVFAGLTVVVALAGLAVVRIPFLTVMGLAASLTVVLAVLLALTLLPALLGFAGSRLDRVGVPGIRMHRAENSGDRALGARWVRAVTARPLAVVLVVLVGLGTVALPALDLRLGLPDDGALPESTTQRQAYDLLSEGFGPGFNGPLAVVVDTADGGSAAAAGAQVAQRLQALPGVVAVAPPTPNAADDTAVVTVIPATGPSSPQTKDLVARIRGQAAELEQATGAGTVVTGQTAVAIDVADRLGEALPVFLAVVVGLALVLLTVVFRSVVVPLKAAAGFLLTIAAALGAVVAVFQWGWLGGLLGVEQTGPILSFLPVLAIAVLFGLAMDYEVFLVSRMREEHVHGAAPTQAVVAGFRHSARVVTAAGLIMVSVFAGFVFGDDPVVKSIGLALAFGILVDAFVVRMTLVPAVLALVGRHAWALPAWLDRVLPDVDIEGERLLRRLQADGLGAAPSGDPREPELADAAR